MGENLANISKIMAYKVKVVEICPKVDKQQTFQYFSYMGISLNNPIFLNSSKMYPFLHWINNNYPKCLLIVGDYLNRYNRQLLYGENMNDAIYSSLEQGNKVLNLYSNLVQQFDRIQIKRWEDLLNNESTKKYLFLLNETYNTNIVFRNTILLSCESFIKRLQERGQKISVSYENAIILSSNYILEEMAVFSYLISIGYKVQIYPNTQLTIFKELANKNIRNTSHIPLSKGIYLDAKIKKI